MLRARGLRLGDPDNYAEVMSRLPELSGEVSDEELGIIQVSGEQYWKSGQGGVASQFTGTAGRKRLAVRIQALLPTAAAELSF